LSIALLIGAEDYQPIKTPHMKSKKSSQNVKFPLSVSVIGSQTLQVKGPPPKIHSNTINKVKPEPVLHERPTSPRVQKLESENSVLKRQLDEMRQIMSEKDNQIVQLNTKLSNVSHTSIPVINPPVVTPVKAPEVVDHDDFDFEEIPDDYEMEKGRKRKEIAYELYQSYKVELHEMMTCSDKVLSKELNDLLMDQNQSENEFLNSFIPLMSRYLIWAIEKKDISTIDHVVQFLYVILESKPRLSISEGLVESLINTFTITCRNIVFDLLELIKPQKIEIWENLFRNELFSQLFVKNDMEIKVNLLKLLNRLIVYPNIFELVRKDGLEDKFVMYVREEHEDLFICLTNFYSLISVHYSLFFAHQNSSDHLQSVLDEIQSEKLKSYADKLNLILNQSGQ
jgi:hypothetical protein